MTRARIILSTLILLAVGLVAAPEASAEYSSQRDDATPWHVYAPDGSLVSEHQSQETASTRAAKEARDRGAPCTIRYVATITVTDEAVPPPQPPVVIEPTVTVSGPAGVIQTYSGNTAWPQGTGYADAQADANRGVEYAVRTDPDIGVPPYIAKVAPLPPPVVLPPLQAGDFDLAPYLVGALNVYVAPNGTGDGTTPEKAMTLAAAQAKYTNRGYKPAHVALRLANGVEHEGFSAHWNTCHGVDEAHPFIIALQDLNGAPATIRSGIHFKEGYGHIIVYGLNFDGTTTTTDANGNVIVGPSGATAIQCSTVTAESAGKVRAVRCRANMNRGIIVQNQTAPAGVTPGKVQFELWDSIVSRTPASGMFTNTGDIRVYTTWFIDCGSHGTKDHGLYITDSNSFVLENCGMVDNSAAGCKVQTMKRVGPYLLRNNLAVANGEVAFPCNINPSYGPYVKGLIAEGNIQTNSNMRMFDLGANKSTVYRRNRVIEGGPAAWLYNLQTGTGATAHQVNDDITIEDSTSYNAGAVIVYNDGVFDNYTLPYSNVKVGGLAWVYAKAPPPTLPHYAALAAKNAGLGFQGVTFTAPNLYAASYVEAQGFSRWDIHSTGRVSADWWRQNSPEQFTTGPAPKWKDPGRTALRYNVEVLGGEATLASFKTNIYAGKVSPRAVREWIEAGYEVIP